MILKNPDGTITYYKILGDEATLKNGRTSKTLLMLHGIGADHAIWEQQIQTYASLGVVTVI